MRKLKLLIAVAALASWGSAAHAQTDVTATYLTNADLSSTNGWTQSSSGGFYALGNGLIGTYKVHDSFSVATVDDTHLATENCFGFECRWSTNFASYNQTTSELPGGRYELTFDVENVNGSTNNATYNNLFYVKVGETTYSDKATEWMRGKSSWTNHSISFAITQPAAANVSFGYGTGDNNFGQANTPVLYVSHVKLTQKPYTYKTVYLAPGAWDASDATERYALYMFNSDTDNAWASFTEGADGVWSAQFNDAYSKMIICRQDGNTEFNSTDDWGNKWNQTENLDAPGADGLLYTINAGGDNPAFSISIPSITLASFTDGGKYLFKNIGSGKYFGPANNAGTQASLIQPSHFNTLHAQTGGAYTIESQVNNGGTSYYFNGSYMDNGNAAWLNIYQVSEGIYVIAPSDNTLSFFGYDGNSTVLAAGLADYNNPNTQWQIVKYEDALNDATQENPVDATFMVLDQNFDRNNRHGSAWTVAASNSNLSGGEDYNRIAESWRSAFTVSQTITVPNGYYKVRAQAAITEYDATGTDLPVVYVEGATIASTPFPICTNGNSGMGQFSANFRDGQFYTEWTDLVSVTTKSLTVGVKGTRTNSWCVWDNIQLMYYGPLDLSDFVAAYETALATAKEKATLHMSNTALAELNAAIDTYDTGKVDETDQSALETATDALNTAISNANASIAKYAELLAAITNANTTYPTAFEAGETLLNNAVTTAQGVYDAAEVDDCADAITALTNGIHAAYESDYNTFATNYEYDYSTLLSSDLTQWTTTNYAVMSGTEHWNGGTGQRYYEQSSAEWGQNAWSKNASETATLPAGKYVMSITARASADVTQTMSVKIGNNDALVVSLPHKGSVGRGVTTAGVGSFADGNTYANNNNGRGWEYRFIAFELAEESSVTISFNSSTDKQYNWCSIAAPLLKGNVHPNQVKLNQVHTLKATLEGYENSISAETYATFADNIAAAGAATLESTNLDDIIAALHADIEIAKAEKAEFDRGAAMNALNTGDNSVVLTDEATRDNWTPAPELNTWSTEADNTDMVTPFLQNWQARENGGLADNTETYVPIRGLQKGYYEVSALVRIYAENGAEPSATYATFTVNGTSVNLLDGTNFEYNNMKGVYKNVRIVVSTDDALNISLAYSGANFNWIAWKNLKVTYLTENAAPVYAIAGSGSIFSGSWDQATQTDILEGSEGVYTKTYADQDLNAQTIQYKMIKKDLVKATHATTWYDNNTGNNLTIGIPVKGRYDITFTFTEEGSVVAGVATKTAEAVTIGEKGWATTVTNSPLNFAEQSKVKAYTATVADDFVTLTEVNDVQAETGLVLKGTEGTYYLPVIESSETEKGSLMFSSTETYNTWGEHTFYGLIVNDNNEAQFRMIDRSQGEVTIPAGKAFLMLDNPSAARELRVVFAGEATGISSITAEKNTESIYNMKGQRVSAPAKGLYIVNGKKVVMK
jgi:hypothetical protein